MTVDDRSLVHPEAVPGWWLDHHLGDVAGAALYAARRAVALESGQAPEYVTVLIARDDGHARVALELLGPTAVTHDALRVALGPDAALALVLPSMVVPPSDAQPVSAVLPPRPQPAAIPPAPPIVPIRRARRDASTRSRSSGRHAIGRRVATGVVVAILVVVGARAFGTGAGAGAAAAPPAVHVEAWDPATATATVRHGDRLSTYVLGAPGDQLLLGDWDGDGVRTPALYRTSTGEVWAFDRWAGDGEATNARALGSHPIGGTPRVERDQGRETVVVDPPER